MKDEDAIAAMTGTVRQALVDTVEEDAFMTKTIRLTMTQLWRVSSPAS